MRTLVVMGALVLLGSLVRVELASADPPQALASRCPGYRVQIERAQQALKGGKRESAVAALHKAQEALRQCIRDEASTVQPLAACQRDWRTS